VHFPKIRMSWIIALVVVLFAAGCGGSSGSDKGDSAQKTIGISWFTDCPYCAPYLSSMQARLTGYGYKVVVADANSDVQLQNTQLLDLIAKGVDGIIIFPGDDKAFIPALVKAKAAGIKILNSNSPIDPSASDTVPYFTGADLYQQGVVVAQHANEDLGGEGNILEITGITGTPAYNLRMQGFEDELEKLDSNIKILDMQAGDWDQTAAQKATAAMLPRYGDDIVGIYGQSDNMAYGAYLAVKDAGLTDQVKYFWGIGGAQASLQAIKDGEMTGLAWMSPIDDGTAAADGMHNLIEGKPQPKKVIIPDPWVDSSNVADFSNQGW
jgi:ribose transport system substrate-binding protein